MPERNFIQIPGLTKDQHRDIYLEVEEDALNEGKESRAKAKRIISNPKWISNEAHDIGLRRKFDDNQKKILHDFLVDEFLPQPKKIGLKDLKAHELAALRDVDKEEYTKREATELRKKIRGARSTKRLLQGVYGMSQKDARGYIRDVKDSGFIKTRTAKRKSLSSRLLRGY